MITAWLTLAVAGWVVICIALLYAGRGYWAWLLAAAGLVTAPWTAGWLSFASFAVAAMQVVEIAM